MFKSVSTDAGKEVTCSKNVLDNDGKEYTLFLVPKPIKGKPLDKGKMFGGQLQYLFKQVETSSKCEKHGRRQKEEYGWQCCLVQAVPSGCLEPHGPAQWEEVQPQPQLPTQRMRTMPVLRLEGGEPPQTGQQVEASMQSPLSATVSPTFQSNNLANCLS